MMVQHIIINRTSETVLRFLPPYILERKHVEIAVAALDRILTSQTEFASHAPATGDHAHG
jgi:acetylornithine/N-succinyldiaminopimelate aminotransferase